MVPKLLLIDEQDGRTGALAFGIDKDETNEGTFINSFYINNE